MNQSDNVGIRYDMDSFSCGFRTHIDMISGVWLQFYIWHKFSMQSLPMVEIKLSGVWALQCARLWAMCRCKRSGPNAGDWGQILQNESLFCIIMCSAIYNYIFMSSSHAILRLFKVCSFSNLLGLILRFAAYRQVLMNFVQLWIDGQMLQQNYCISISQISMN